MLPVILRDWLRLEFFSGAVRAESDRPDDSAWRLAGYMVCVTAISIVVGLGMMELSKLIG